MTRIFSSGSKSTSDGQSNRLSPLGTGFNVGVVYDLSKEHHLLFSAGVPSMADEFSMLRRPTNSHSITASSISGTVRTPEAYRELFAA